MSQFGGSGALPPGQPPFGRQPDWPGRMQGFPPPIPGRNKRKGLKPSEVQAEFDLKTPGIVKLAFLGSFLQFITLGIYRFWFLVHLRRQLWQRSSLAGSPFEYTGTPGEIFRGFLLALILLLPIWVSYGLGTALLQTAQYQVIAGVLVAFAVVAFMFFAYFALYRGRRYRVSRTLWRGVRFRQTGSGLLYAIMSFGWLLLALPTLGLSIPFARAQLERYRINHMWFGNRPFESYSTGRMMLGPFLLYYAGIVGPVAIGAAIWLASLPQGSLVTFVTDLQAIGRGIAINKPPNLNNDASVLTAILGIIALMWLFTVPFLLWPAYRACELRRFIGRISIGTTRFRAKFTAVEIYVCYIIFFLILSGGLTGIGIVSAIIVGIGFGVGAALGVATTGSSAAIGGMILSFAAVLVSYLGMLLVLSVLRIRIFLFELTGRLIASTIVDGMDHLQDIVSQSDNVGAMGDDFAGGFDIGAI